jgi:hypothetical protein
MKKKAFPPFEGSKYDNDKGVKEGSKADKARDKKEKARMKGTRRGR